MIETTEKTAVGLQQMANPRVATLLMYLTGRLRRGGLLGWHVGSEQGAMRTLCMATAGAAARQVMCPLPGVVFAK